MLITILIALVVAFAAMQASGFCTTIYLHRAMAHKGLRLHPAVAMLMRIELWLFTGINMREWVAVHRKHHHFTDEEGDPHSPYLVGLWKVLFLNAFYYAREAKKPEVIEKYTRDIPRTRVEAVLGRGSLGLGVGLAMFVALFWAIQGGWAGPVIGVRSEERRGGKECGLRGRLLECKKKEGASGGFGCVRSVEDSVHCSGG